MSVINQHKICDSKRIPPLSTTWHKMDVILNDNNKLLVHNIHLIIGFQSLSKAWHKYFTQKEIFVEVNWTLRAYISICTLAFFLTLSWIEFEPFQQLCRCRQRLRQPLFLGTTIGALKEACCSWKLKAWHTCHMLLLYKQEANARCNGEKSYSRISVVITFLVGIDVGGVDCLWFVVHGHEKLCLFFSQKRRSLRREHRHIGTSFFFSSYFCDSRLSHVLMVRWGFYSF